MNTRTWAEINLDALKNNIKEVRRITSPDALVMAVVKADGYGHGAVESANIFLENGADRLAVACYSESLQLRNAGIDAPILILGASFEDEIEGIVINDVTLSLYSYEFAKKVSKVAKQNNKIAKIHIKIDTGMSRLGFVAGVNDKEIIDEIMEISKLDNIEIEGIFSHFSTSDEKNPDYTNLQFVRFMKICNGLEKIGLKIPIRHIANSAAIMMHPNTHLDMVRAGIVLYGLYPSDEVDKTKLNLVVAMSIKSQITQIKEISDNRGVSYGKRYITNGKTKIATVPIGYADGYTRKLSGKAKMLVGDQMVDVIGTICMDQCMIDVTSVNNINTGDEVTIFGSKTVTAENLAVWQDTISYEVVCMVSKRIPRVFYKNGRMVSVLDYLNR